MEFVEIFRLAIHAGVQIRRWYIAIKARVGGIPISILKLHWMLCSILCAGTKKLVAFGLLDSQDPGITMIAKCNGQCCLS